MMKSTAGTEALVALETEAPEALFALLPGTDLPLWPMLRWPAARAMAIKELDAVNVPTRVTRAQLMLRAVDAATPHTRHSRRAPRNRPVLFVVPGTRTTAIPTGLTDQLVGDHAASLGGEALIVRDVPVPPWTPASRRPGPTRTVSFDDAVFRSELTARFRPPSAAHLEQAHAAANAIIDHLQYPLDAQERASALRSFTIRFRRLATMRDGYRRLLDRVAPRVLFVQQGAYGDRMALIAEAHRRCIHVAEHQHGFIGPSHGAYNFGPAMAREPLRTTLPDTLLTFGDFWGRGIRVPFDVVPVGKPLMDDSRDRATAPSERPRAVTVLSSVYNQESTQAATLAIRQTLSDDWDVRFRPHPSERATVAERYPELAAHPGITIDDEADALRAMSDTRAVVGVASTALYEALALGCHVIVRDSPMFTDTYIDRTVFGTIVNDGDELAGVMRALQNDELTLPAQTDIDAIWAPGSLARFSEFVTRF